MLQTCSGHSQFLIG